MDINGPKWAERWTWDVCTAKWGKPWHDIKLWDLKQLRRAQTRIIRKKDGRQTGRSGSRLHLGSVTKDSLSSEETRWSGVAYRNPNSWELKPSKFGVKPIAMAMWTSCRVSLLVFKENHVMCLSENTVRQWFGLSSFFFRFKWRFCRVFRHSPIFWTDQYFFIIGNPSDRNPCELVMSNEIAFGTLFLRGVRFGLASHVTMTPAFSGCWEKWVIYIDIL